MVKLGFAWCGIAHGLGLVIPCPLSRCPPLPLVLSAPFALQVSACLLLSTLIRFVPLNPITRCLAIPGSLLTQDKQGCIISTFVSPKDPNWNFERFYNFLSDKGCVIYPGKLTKVDSFRIGTIGHLFPEQFEMLLGVIQEVPLDAVMIFLCGRGFLFFFPPSLSLSLSLHGLSPM